MKPKTSKIARLVPLIFTVSLTSLHATVNPSGVDSTTGANWRTAAALETDNQYGTLGYVVFGLNAANAVYAQPYNIGIAETRNAYSLPAGIAISTADSNIGMWSGNGNFGMMQDPGSGNAPTAAPVLAGSNGPKQFTITRSTNTAYRITLMTVSGDGANANYSLSVNDGSETAGTSHTHTANGLAYHVYDVSAGTSNVVISITSTPNWSLNGIAFDTYVIPPQGPALTWVGASGAWDTSAAENWKKTSDNSAATFANFPPSPVLFDDTAASKTVDISAGDVTPFSVTCDTNAGYTLQGTNGIAGGNGLTKSGAGTLTLLNANTYSGSTSINAGTLELGGTGSLGAAGNYSGAFINNGTVIHNSTAAQTISGVVSGTGSLTNQTGTLTLTNANTYTGNVLVSGGTLVPTLPGAVATGSSFGSLNVAGKTITVTSGATLRHGNNDLYFNSVANYAAETVKLIIDGGTLNTGSFFSSVKDIDIHSGAAITGTNGVVPQFRSLGLCGTITCAGGTGDASTIASPGATGGLHLGNSALGVSSTTFHVDAASGGLLVTAPLINQAASLATGSLVKTGDGKLTLSGASTYTGATTVNAGTLEITGSLGNSTSAVTVNATATLAGNGTISRPVTIASGGTLTPAGSAIGTMVTGNLTLNSGTKITCQIDKTGGVLTQDLMDTLAVQYGGTLEIVASGEAMALGDTFQLFTATPGAYTGSFASFVKPTLPGGLSWDFSRLATDGTIEVVNNAPTPLFNPGSGGYVGALSVTISSDTGTTIHYTMDGTDPRTSGTALTAASSAGDIIIPTDTATMTLTAYASQAGKGDSPSATATYSTITTPTWNVDGDGSWSDAANWKNSVVPGAIGVTANFNSFPQTFSSTVTLDGSRTVGSLVFGNPDASDWTLAASGGSVLTLATAAGSPVIAVESQNAILSPALAGTQGFVKSGTGNLRLANGGSSFTGDITLNGGTVLASSTTGETDPVTGPLGNPGVARTITVNNGATLSFGANDIFGNHISTVAVGVVINSGGTVTNNGGFFTTLGLVTLNGGTLHATGGAVAIFPAFSLKGTVTALTESTSVISGTGSFASYHLGDGLVTGTTFDVQGSGALTISGVLEDGRNRLHTVHASYLTKSGTGTLTLGTINTYTGNTTVNTGTLVLADNARLQFTIGDTSSTCNELSGAGTVILDGDFAINTAAAAALTSGSWTLEKVASLTGSYGATFSVVDPDGTPWTDADGDKWTKTVGTQKWTFDETTGTLTLGQGGFSSWISGFGLALEDQDPTDDPDHDGVNNLVEYALAGRNPTVADGSAGMLTGHLLSFAKRTDASGITLVIQESDDLGLADQWAEVGSYTENSGTTISYTLPGDKTRTFARLAVTQAP